MKKFINDPFVKKVGSQAIVEILASTTIVCITFFLTFYFKGEKGVTELIKAFIQRLDTNDHVNVCSMFIVLVMGFIFYGLYYFFNTRLKNILKKVAKAYIDIIINMSRLISSYFLGFFILYMVDSFFSDFKINKSVFSLLAFGLLFLLTSSVFVTISEEMISRKERPLKKI